MVFNVAIIGSGVAAASTCYYLKKKYNDDVKISVFEKKSGLGGRAKCFRVEGHTLEIGAGIAYTGNRYIHDWTKQFGLKKLEMPSNSIGLWDGKSFPFKSTSSDYLTKFSMLYRYGLINTYNLRSIVTKAVSCFDEIYRAQDQGLAFSTPEELWKHCGLYDYSQKKFEDVMNETLSKDSFLLKELLYSVNAVNYNQSNDINGLAGLVSMCPLVTGEVFVLENGFVNIVKNIMKTVDSVYTSTPITKISQTFTIGSTEPVYTLESYGQELGKFDAVVIASPVDSRLCIDLMGTPLDLALYSRKYQITHSTFIKGKVNPSYFNEKDFSSVPQSIYLTEAANEKFSCIREYFKSKNGIDSVYKVFSEDPLTFDVLAKVFAPYSHIVYTKEWKAYPFYCAPETLNIPFRVHPEHRIYCSGIIEWAVSAMEVSAIGGRNVALLLQNDIENSKKKK